MRLRKICAVVLGGDFLSEGPGKNLLDMDAQMRKTFSLKTEVLGVDPVMSSPSMC